MTINNVKGSQTNNHVTGDQTNNYVTGNQTHVEVTGQPNVSTGNITRTVFILLLLELYGLIKNFKPRYKQRRDVNFSGKTSKNLLGPYTVCRGG